MARTVDNEDERLRRIIMVGKYVAETGSSTRKTAKYFTENYFPISNYTVLDYCNRYKKLEPALKDKIVSSMKENKPISVEDESVKQRIKQVVKLLKEGFTLEEIANSLHTSYWTIYRDISSRIDKLVGTEITLEELKEVKNILSLHSSNNLNVGNSSFINQNRDDKGRFTK